MRSFELRNPCAASCDGAHTGDDSVFRIPWRHAILSSDTAQDPSTSSCRLPTSKQRFSRTIGGITRSDVHTSARRACSGRRVRTCGCVSASNSRAQSRRDASETSSTASPEPILPSLPHPMASRTRHRCTDSYTLRTPCPNSLMRYYARYPRPGHIVPKCPWADISLWAVSPPE